MIIEGEELLPYDPATVWRALNDPTVLQTAIPGCEMLEAYEDGYRITLQASVGPVKARFNGRLAVQNVIALRSYTLVFEGTGGIAGFGKGSADVSLAAAEGGTLLTYGASAQVGGRLAQVGARLIDGVARRMATEFFTRFRECMPPGPDARVAAGPLAAATQLPGVPHL